MPSQEVINATLSAFDNLAKTETVPPCTPYLCPELALEAPMTKTLKTILQCIAFALVVIADCLHLLFLVRAARTAVYNRSTITVLCLLSATQITFATTNAPLIFLLTGIPETITCKLASFVTAWWRSATSLFLLLTIWQQYASQLTVLMALCGPPKTVDILKANTSEAARRLARKFPVSSPLQVVNAAVTIAIFSLLASVYTVVLFDSTKATYKDERFGYFFTLQTCTFDPAMTQLARPIFMFDVVFSLMLPFVLSAASLLSMRHLPHLAKTLFSYNKIHLRIVLKQLSTHCCDIAVPLFILIFFAGCTSQHFAISIYRLWLWDSKPFDSFPKCQRSSDVIVLLFPPVCAVLLHVWCRDIVRKENGLYDPGPTLLAMAKDPQYAMDAPHFLTPGQESPPDYQPADRGKHVAFSPSVGIPNSLSANMRQHTLIPASPPSTPDIGIYGDRRGGSVTPENAMLSPDIITPEIGKNQKPSPCLVTIETSL